MIGTVVAVNAQRGLVGVQIEDGSYGFAVAEVLDYVDYLARGDVVRGELRAHGREKWHNETQDRDVEIFIETFDATRDNMLTLMR